MITALRHRTSYCPSPRRGCLHRLQHETWCIGRFPEATIFSLSELQKHGPLPGLAHLSIATSKHHGMRRAEVTARNAGSLPHICLGGAGSWKLERDDRQIVWRFSGVDADAGKGKGHAHPLPRALRGVRSPSVCHTSVNMTRPVPSALHMQPEHGRNVAQHVALSSQRLGQ